VKPPHIFLVVAAISFVLEHGTAKPLDYYHLHFDMLSRQQPQDTLFEKIVWHKKVSHLVIEVTEVGFKVTLLMIQPAPDKYKSQNYPIFYFFKTHAEAYEKFVWLDEFIRNDGVLRVKINGSQIQKEKILYRGQRPPSLKKGLEN